MKLEFSAGGIIYRKNGANFEFALILDSYGKWTFPKGHIEKGEKPEVAAKREVSEEIGLKNLKVNKLLEKIDYWFKFENETYHKYVYFFLMGVGDNSELSPQTTEIKEAKWFSAKEAIKHLAYKKDSEIILKKAFEELGIVIS